MNDEERSAGQPGIVVPADGLSREALRDLIEEFVTRDGTDYGAVERGIDEKVQRVMDQLRTNEASLVFDPETETVNIVLASELPEPVGTPQP